MNVRNLVTPEDEVISAGGKLVEEPVVADSTASKEETCTTTTVNNIQNHKVRCVNDRNRKCQNFLSDKIVEKNKRRKIKITKCDECLEHDYKRKQRYQVKTVKSKETKTIDVTNQQSNNTTVKTTVGKEISKECKSTDSTEDRAKERVYAF